VDERATISRREDWFSPVADNAVKAFLADAQSDRALVSKLASAWGTRKEIVDKQQTRAKLAEAAATLSAQQDETRKNLRAIEKNKSAEALRAKLTQRLGDMATKIDDLTRQVVELDSKLAELRVVFKEAVREINYVAPPKPAGS
jgi:chromosome segregation ATPase